MKTRLSLPFVLLLPVAVTVFLAAIWWLSLERTRTDLLNARQLSLQQTADSVARALAMNEAFVAVLGDINDDASSFLHSTEITDVALDGREQDWPADQPMTFGLNNLLEIYFPYTTDSLGYELRVGNDKDTLYLFFKVSDDVVVYRQVNNLSVHRNDHIQLAVATESGDFYRYTLATVQPSDVTAHVIAPGGRALRQEPRISGRWRATDSGYNLEVAMPLELAAGRFSAVVVDVDEEETRDVKYVMGAAPTTDPGSLGRLILSPGPIARAVELLPFDMVAVISRDDAVMVSRGQAPSAAGTIEVSADISLGGGEFGKLVIRDAAVDVTALIDSLRMQVMVVSLVAIVFALSASLVIHSHIKGRLTALTSRIDQLADSRGRVSHLPLEPDTDDELGRFAANLEPWLNRVSQYNDYLERMASRLNHELRTPLSVVRSSLENLDSLPEDQRVYIERAQNGIQRLTNILNKISEARRLEDSLDEDEIVRFDLAEIVRSCVNGYESAYPGVEFKLSIESDKVPVTGIPELFAQLIDKLIDNAVEFSDGDAIKVRLNKEGQSALLRILNNGPELPVELPDQLFESMVSHRHDDTEGHLGLGLYVAKIIAGFHGGEIRLANREDAKGVIATVEVPLLRVTSKLR